MTAMVNSQTNSMWSEAMTMVLGDAVHDVRSLQTHLGNVGTPAKLHADREFAAQARGTTHRGTLLGHVAAAEHVSHNVTIPARHQRGPLVFTRVKSGYARFEQHGRTADLGPGDFGVYASDSPYKLHFQTPYEIVGIVVPARSLMSIGYDVDSLLGLRIPGDDPIVAALGQVIDALEAVVHDAPIALQGRFVDQALETVETLSRYWAVAGGGANTNLLDRSLEYIDENLGDPELRPARVAGALFVSVRTLYSVFESAGISVAAMIRERRLERCRKDLADPARFDEPVASIGARWGFTSPSYFSAVFVRGSGLSPRDFRQHALAASIAKPMRSLEASA
jgi:AraC-like DNA-binding protein